MNAKVTEHEIHLLDSGHDWQEEGVDEEEVSPMEEDLWIEKCESIHIEVPHKVISLSLINSNLIYCVQTIFEEYLRLWAGEFDVWSRLEDEGNDVDHMVIRRPEEGIWVTFQMYSSNRSINLLYPQNEGATPIPNTASENIEQ